LTVTASVRDVAGVETVVADAGTAVVVLEGEMSTSDVLAALEVCGYIGELIPEV
jgi:hypothetical protein